MANFSDLFPDNLLMDVLGDDIIYQPSGGGSFPMKAIIDRDIEFFGADGLVAGFRTEIEFLISGLSFAAKRDDRISAGSENFVVDAEIANDGTYIKLTVH